MVQSDDGAGNIPRPVHRGTKFSFFVPDTLFADAYRKHLELALKNPSSIKEILCCLVAIASVEEYTKT